MSELLRCVTCERTALPLTTHPDGVTHCYPCMALDGHMSIGATFERPEDLRPANGWRVLDGEGVGHASNLTWDQIKEGDALLDGAAFWRRLVRAPGEPTK